MCAAARLHPGQIDDRDNAQLRDRKLRGAVRDGDVLRRGIGLSGNSQVLDTPGTY